jgi:hypothetical protein
MSNNVISLRRGRDTGPAPPPDAVVVRVHGWKHVAAVLTAARETGRRVTLLAPPGGTYTGGVGFWAAIDRRRHELFADVAADLMVDCDGAPGHVMAALRVGLKRLIFDGNDAARTRLADIAARHGASLLPRPPALLDLIHEKDAAHACRRLFASLA